MMSKLSSPPLYSIIGLCFVATSLLTACERPPVGASDYRTQHRVYAEEKVFSLILPMSSKGQVAMGQNRRRLENFANDYLRRGRGPLLVSHNGEGNIAATSKSTIANTLNSAGVPGTRIFFQARPQNDGLSSALELSYSGYVIRVPKCGDWSGHTGFDPSNRPHTDFGCSFQRDSALMIANPGDLSITSGRVENDTPYSDKVIGTYRRGGRLGTDFPIKETKDFAIEK